MKKHIYPEMILFEKDIAQNVYISKNNFKNYELHNHDFYELEFFVEGNGLCEINGKEYSFRKGDISFATPLDIHGYKGDDNIKIEPKIRLCGKTSKKATKNPLTEKQVQSIINSVPNTNPL